MIAVSHVAFKWLYAKITVDMKKDESDRKRKQKFTDRELKVLNEELQRYASKIHSRYLTATERTIYGDLYLYICVSVVGLCKRSPPECKRRRHDLKSEVEDQRKDILQPN